MNPIGIAGRGLVIAFSVVAAGGCIQSRLAWVEGGMPEANRPYGSYAAKISSSGGLDEDEIQKVFRPGDSADPEGRLEMDVAVSKGQAQDANGGIAYINNVLSVCTLGIWPHVSSETTTYDVSAKSRYGSRSGHVKVGERSWSSFILPIAALPCPGWGDARGDDSSRLASEAVGAALAGMLDKGYYDAAMVSHKKRLSSCREAARRIRDAIEMRGNPSSAEADSRPVVFIGDKSVEDKTGRHVNARTVFERLEHALVKTGLRVETNVAIRKNMADNAFFAVLDGRDVDLSSMKAPAYRVEAMILQYKCESSRQDTPTVYHKKHTFKKASHIEGMTRTWKKDAVVEMTFKFVNLHTGVTEMSKTFSGRSGGSFSSLTSTYSGHKKEESTSTTSGEELRSDDYYLEAASNEAMSKFVDAILELMPFNVVSCSADGTVVVDAPGDFVKKGAVLNIMSLGKEKAGRNGRIYRSEKKVGTVVVTAESGDACTGQIDTVDTLDCDWDVVVRRQKGE